MTDLVAIDVDRVDDFLAHVGVKGMKWGHHKPGAAPVAGGGGRRVANPQKQSWGDRRAASGQRMIDRAGGSTKRAAIHLAGKHVAETIIGNAAMLGVQHIPNPVLRRGASAAIMAIGVGVTVKNVNDATKIAAASRRNKKG